MLTEIAALIWFPFSGNEKDALPTHNEEVAQKKATRIEYLKNLDQSGFSAVFDNLPRDQARSAVKGVYQISTAQATAAKQASPDPYDRRLWTNGLPKYRGCVVKCRDIMDKCFPYSVQKKKKAKNSARKASSGPTTASASVSQQEQKEGPCNSEGKGVSFDSVTAALRNPSNVIWWAAPDTCMNYDHVTNLVQEMAKGIDGLRPLMEQGNLKSRDAEDKTTAYKNVGGEIRDCMVKMNMLGFKSKACDGAIAFSFTKKMKHPGGKRDSSVPGRSGSSTSSESSDCKCHATAPQCASAGGQGPPAPGGAASTGRNSSAGQASGAKCARCGSGISGNSKKGNGQNAPDFDDSSSDVADGFRLFVFGQWADYQ